MRRTLLLLSCLAFTNAASAQEWAASVTDFAAPGATHIHGALVLAPGVPGGVATIVLSDGSKIRLRTARVKTRTAPQPAD